MDARICQSRWLEDIEAEIDAEEAKELDDEEDELQLGKTTSFGRHLVTNHRFMGELSRRSSWSKAAASSAEATMAAARDEQPQQEEASACIDAMRQLFGSLKAPSNRAAAVAG